MEKTGTNPTRRWKNHPWQTPSNRFVRDPQDKRTRLAGYAGEAVAAKARERRLAEGK